MKLNLLFRRLPDTEKNREIIVEALNPLATQHQISAANAVVEQPEQDVSICVSMKVEVAGIPVKAEARDYTLRAVVRKAMDVLRKKLAKRLRRRAANGPNRRHFPAAVRA